MREFDRGDGWAQTTVGALGKLHCGQSPSSAAVNTTGEGIVYVSGPEHWDGAVVHRSKWTTAPTRIAPARSVFVTVKGSGVGTLFPGIDAAIGRDIYAFEPYREVDFRFVYHALQYSIQEVIGRARGDIPGLNKAHLLDHALVVPGPKTQAAVASKIDELFSEIDEGERALERVGQLVERYRQSILKAAVTGELSCTDRTTFTGWRYRPLGDLCTLITSGSRGWSEFYADHGPAFIRAQNIKQDVLDLTDIAHVNLDGVREGLRTRVARGDLLVTITGANVTKTAHVDADLAEAYVSQHVALVRLKDAALARYLYYWLISPANGRAHLLESAYGAGKPGLSLKDLRDLHVPVPPPEQCVRIADLLALELSRLESISAQRKGSGVAASSLRQSILKAAFSGQLVSQDPHDEPASALLARLAAQAAEAPAAPRRRGAPRKNALA